MTYGKDTDRNEPIEIRTTDPFGNRHVLYAWLTERGTVGYNFVSGGGSTPFALDNMHSKREFPRKAVPGWQAEVVAFVQDSTETIVEVR